MKRPMSLLLIEDDTLECDKYKEYARNNESIQLAKVTNSSQDALKFLKSNTVEGVVVDLELHDGEGSGLDFILELNKRNASIRPILFVSTNIHSQRLYNFVHNNQVEFIFYKRSSDYSISKVIDLFLLLRREVYFIDGNIKLKEDDFKKGFENEIMAKINRELDLVGVGSHLVGRKYIKEAIYYEVKPEYDQNVDTAFVHLAKKYHVSNGTISRAIQNAINSAWRRMPTDELYLYYTAKVDHEKGAPTPTEFVYFYVEKLREYFK